MAWIKAVWLAASSVLILAPPHCQATETFNGFNQIYQSHRYAAGCRNGRYPKQCGHGYDYTGFTQDQHARAAAVVEMFRFAWDGYYQHAFPHDSLRPQNNSWVDDRNGWGLTAIDALDTAIIMQQRDIVDIIIEFVTKIDFTKNNADEPVTTSLFETNIRYIGGLLSSYDLLKGPFDHLAYDDKRVDSLLHQAKALADVLKFCFDTPSGIPVNLVYIDNQTFADSAIMANGVRTAGLAELGTLVLEWQRLSDLTGDPSYGELAQRAESYWFKAPEVWPGLTGGNFSVETGELIDNYGGWTSGNDSAYEYLIKMYVYDPDRYRNYSQRWIDAADSTISHLLSNPSTRSDLAMAATFDGNRQLQNYSEGLACFIGGNFILGATVLKNKHYLEPGLIFAEFCANGYRYSSSGIGPVLYSWDLDLLRNPNYTNQTRLYREAGWFIPNNNAFVGGQAPEAVESWYYAYQATNDTYWRDVAWAYTLAQNKTLRVGSGFASINNVLRADGGGNRNFMQSFMLAEVLKYQYLIQAPNQGIWEVMYGKDKLNYFVYNTEAHPIRVAAKYPI